MALPTDSPNVHPSPKRRLSKTGFEEEQTKSPSVFDVVIVGGGISGLSAAATIVRQDHTVLILDSQMYRNAGSPYMHTVATWDHRSPEEWRAAARKDFERYGTVSVEYETVEEISKMADNTFRITSPDQRLWNARKVILATGVEDIFPNIEGYAENWISGM